MDASKKNGAANENQSEEGCQRHQSDSSAAVSAAPVAADKLLLYQTVLDGRVYHVVVNDSGAPIAPPAGVNTVLSSIPSAFSSARVQLELSTPVLGDEPLYVNAKQYHRILKRRQQRAKLEAQGKLPKTRQKYMYASRHLHALKRHRGAKGRFAGTASPTAASAVTSSDDNGVDSGDCQGGQHMQLSQAEPRPLLMQPDVTCSVTSTSLTSSSMAATTVASQDSDTGSSDVIAQHRQCVDPALIADWLPPETTLLHFDNASVDVSEASAASKPMPPRNESRNAGQAYTAQ